MRPSWVQVFNLVQLAMAGGWGQMEEVPTWDYTPV